MSDDLVKEMRSKKIVEVALFNKAAVRIEILEEALRWYENFDPDAVEAIRAKVEALDAIAALQEEQGK